VENNRKLENKSKNRNSTFRSSSVHPLGKLFWLVAGASPAANIDIKAFNCGDYVNRERLACFASSTASKAAEQVETSLSKRAYVGRHQICANSVEVA
jgi:hypothetical protein